MLVLAVIGSAALAAVNAFGAWVTQNRRRWLALLFMLAALLLVLAAAALAWRLGLGLWLLGAGLLLTWLSSLLHAHLVTRNLVWQNHLLRAAVTAAIFVLAAVSLR